MEDKRIIDMTLDNAIAISKLTEVSLRTSKDVDKLIRHHEILDNTVMKVKTVEEKVDNLSKEVKTDKKQIDLIYVIFRYPKITALIVAISYTLAIKEVRDSVIETVRPILKLFGL